MKKIGGLFILSTLELNSCTLSPPSTPLKPCCNFLLKAKEQDLLFEAAALPLAETHATN